MAEYEQDPLPLGDDPEFQKWERGARAQHRGITAPLDRLKERIRERLVDRADGERWEDDPVVRTREGRVCRESELTRGEVEAGGITYLEEDQDLDVEEDGQPF